ncbi:ulp1 protease family, C-terminal catalytic domain-containing protein [Tanacetum coccineum]|uniref:Ulp1 protease family, C-terminal catalytic domain-containing protein n=1 Tax=Tanacetum coccineum TaxID=301880 RepID=A0ABQ5J782_9ASTR
MSSVRRLPKEKGPIKLKAVPLKPKLAVKPKAAPFKPKLAVKQSVSKRNRSVDDVVSDVINYLYDSKVVKRKKSVEDEDSVGSDENVVSNERGDGDQDQDSNKDVESNKDEVSNRAEESDKDDEANQTEEESNNDEESNKDEEIDEAEENDQQLVNNLTTKIVKRKTATKGKKKDVASESDSESEDEMGKKKDVISEFDSKSEAEMVKKRGKKMKVALKSKKREPVSEDNVLKVKKNLKKKKKQVSDSSSSFEEEKPIMKKKKLDAKKKKKKPITLAQIKKEKYLRGFPPLYSRTVPCSLFSAIRDSQVDMKSFLSDIGFSSLHNVFIDTLPSRFSRFVVRAFNASTYEFKLEKGVIRVTPDKVNDILGVPLGGTSNFDLPERPLDDDFVKMWFNQFDPKPLKDIHATDISEKLVLSKKVDFMFKVNFLMLFANVMGTADTMKAIVNLTSVVPNTLTGFYIGPFTFLILLYLDLTKFEWFPVIRSRPAIQNWTTTAINKQQDLEIMDEVIGRLELHGPWFESELHETEGFYEVGDNVSRTRSSLNSPTDKQSVCSLIEEKLKFICDEKAELEDILRKANTQFSNDVGVFVLYEKYVGVFKDIVFLEDEYVHVDDFHPGDGEKEDLFVWPLKVPVDVHRPKTAEGRVTCSSPKKRISKPSAYLSSPYMNKKTVVIAQVKRLEFVLGNSVFAMQGDTLETVFQTSTGPDVSSIRLNMETLAPTLWIDANVVDCWVAILNHEEFVKVDPSPKRHFFTSGCITSFFVLIKTQATIEGRITEKQQWKMFSAEISAQFQNNLAGKSLSEVELAFFPIYASGHFYLVVFNIKKGLMIILDNSDCGETYTSKYKDACELQKKFFSRYLSENNHPLHEKVAKVKARIPKLKWSTTKNHVDCGVFLMIHMESYIGEPAARWNVGLCTESHTQDSLLRRMRYKIAAKILLHELNIHSQKMFDLAYKFETENDEHSRISIIVNAIKNRAERDPDKNVVENEEGDAVKNIK